MPAMTAAERLAFLDEPGVLCRIATVTPAGAPHVAPVWFICVGDEIFITPRERSSWLAHIRREPRVALSIDEQAAPYRKITVQGTARLAFEPGDDDRWRDLYRDIARRYVPPEAADRYIAETIDQPRALLAVGLDKARVFSWRMPLPGEPYTGIWHRRYYAGDSEMARRSDATATPRPSP
jgi:PPOX class probable F420-dependent enzyme